MIPITPHNVRLAFGMALEAAGLANAAQNIGDLLDLGYQEKFAEYFPATGAFQTFRDRFSLTRFQLMKQLKWKYDKDLLDFDPGHHQEIRDYFITSFKPAIKATESGDSDD